MNRILFLSTGLNCGGAEMQIFHLAKGLQARGWQAQVVAMLSGGSIAEMFEESSIPVHDLGIRRGVPDIRAFMRLRKIILMFRPDVVHSHMTHANLLARMTRAICPIPVLVNTIHNMTEHRRWTELAYKMTNSMADLTTIICQAAAERYVKIGAVAANRVQVVVNGLPIEQFRPDSRSRAAIRQELEISEEFVWLAVGRMEAPKDYGTLVRAVAQTRNGLFLVAGDGPLRREMEQLAAELRVLDRIRFLGIRRDVPRLMAAADAYVMSSAWEGLPMVLLEAAASGLPIVATNVGGNSAIVRDGISGYVVPPCDPQALARAMQRMQMDPARPTMGSVARDFVEKHFSLSAVLDQWESIYRAFMEKPLEEMLAQGAAL